MDELLIRARDSSPLTDLQSSKSATKQDQRLERKMGAIVEDPLRLKGEFPQRERSFWSPGDRVGPFKREDNLRIEGEFTMRSESQAIKERTFGYFGKGDLIKRADNIKLDGEFSQREKMQWCPGDQTIPCNREDNLKLEGDFGQRGKLKNPWGAGGFGGKMDKLRQKDNIEVGREKVSSSGDRVSLSKMEENLRREGEFCKKEEILNWKDNITKFGDSLPQREEARWTPDDLVGRNEKEERLPRQQQYLRGRDNLTLEGKFSERDPRGWNPGERVKPCCRTDNLEMEGEFSQREARGWNPGEKVKPCRRRDNLEMEGEFSKREDVLLQDQILRRFSTRTKANSFIDEGRMGGTKTGVWDRGELIGKVVRPDNLSLR